LSINSHTLFFNVYHLGSSRRHHNLEDTIKVLINNGYPLRFIFSTINNRVEQFSVSGIKQRWEAKIDNKEDNRPFFTIPYVKNTSDNFRSISKKHNLNLAFSTSNSLTKFIKTGKDPVDHSSCYNVVYQIKCRDCEASYVGQTKRPLKTRIKEHLEDINKSSGLLSVVSNHRVESNHDFKWSETRILDREPSWK